MNPNDMTGYPTLDQVQMVASFGNAPDSVVRGIIKAAIDIERERVAREAGEVSCWRYVLGNGHPFAWDCGSPPADAVVTADIHGWTIELAYTRPPSLPADEAQNSAVKVPDDVMEAAKWMFDVMQGPRSKLLHEFLQSLTHPTETPR